MKTLEFKSEELELLEEVLRRAIHEMNVEVVRTDIRSFKEELKHRRALLDDILAKVTPTPAPV